MCSLGRHQEDDDIRPPRRRRHSDGTSSAILAATPAATLRERKKVKTAELARILADEQPDLQFSQDEFLNSHEPLPPGVDQLPDHLIAEATERATENMPYWSRMS
jgi:hypothetical protein